MCQVTASQPRRVTATLLCGALGKFGFGASRGAKKQTRKHAKDARDMMQAMQIQQSMGHEFQQWQSQLAEAATRYQNMRTILGIEEVSGKYLRLKWTPEQTGQYEDRGQMGLGSNQSLIANTIAANAMNYVGQRVRILDALVEKDKNQGRGFRQVVWVGMLPPEFDVPEYEGGDGTAVPWTPPGAGQIQQPVQQPMQQQQMPMQQQQMPMQQQQMPPQQMPPQQPGIYNPAAPNG